MASEGGADALMRGTADHGDRDEIRERHDDELRAGEDGEERDAHDRRIPAARRSCQRAGHDREREQEGRVAGRVGHEVRVVEQARSDDSRDRNEQRGPPAHHVARQPVRREHGRRHHERVQQLRNLVCGFRVRHEPRRRLDQHGDGRREEVGLAA